MIRLILVIFSCLALGGLFYYLADKDSGYFLIVWGKTSVEMSLWFALIVSAASALLLFLVLYLTLGGYRGLSMMARSLFDHNNRLAEERTLRGLLYFIEGNWYLAKRNLVKAAQKTSSPLINYLAAARSAYELGDQKDALKLLNKAEQSTSNSSLAVALTQARMQLANHHYEQTVATLARAAEHSSNHPMVLELLKQAYIALKDWSSLKLLLPKLQKYQVGKAEELEQLEAMLYREWITDTIEQSRGLSVEQGITSVRDCWSQIPKKNRYDLDTVTLYARYLIAAHHHDEAEELLESSLKKHWHDQWIDLYGQLTSSNAKKSLLTAEGWLKDRPSNSALLLAVGRLCVSNQQWGRAKEYFKASLEQQESPEAYAQLAHLLAELGENEASSIYYRKGLLMVTDNLSGASQSQPNPPDHN